MALAYRISYCEAWPVSPSSPGAVQVKVKELGLGLPTARSVIALGDVSSGAGGGVDVINEKLTVVGEPKEALTPV